MSSVVLRIEAAAESDQAGDDERNDEHRQRDLGEHLPAHQVGDREHAVKGDGDEQQSIDDPAQRTGDRAADRKPGRARALGPTEYRKDGDVAEFRSESYKSELQY